MNSLIADLPLIILILFFIGYTINSLFIIYHLLRFGLDYKTKLLVFVFSIGSIFLIIANFQLFSKIQWAQLEFYRIIQFNF